MTRLKREVTHMKQPPAGLKRQPPPASEPPSPYTINQEFTSYKVEYYSGNSPEAVITCLAYIFDKITGGSIQPVGWLKFYREDSEIPPNDPWSIHYSLSRFNDVMALLRYEKPLYFTVFDKSGEEEQVGAVMTSYPETPEPVGEQEAKG